MIFNVQTTGFKLTSGLLDAIKEQTHHLRAHGRAPIGRLDIVLRDLNGSKGGADKCCRIQCKLQGHEQIIAHVVSDDMYAAIHQSFGRLQRSIDKTAQKKIAKRRELKVRFFDAISATTLRNVNVKGGDTAHPQPQAW